MDPKKSLVTRLADELGKMKEDNEDVKLPSKIFSHFDRLIQYHPCLDP